MLREGRIGSRMDENALTLSSSLEHDRNIFYYDILVDIAHVLTLNRSGYLSDSEAAEIISALKAVRNSGVQEGYEDIHEAIEAEVTKITPAGKKMHTGRSRNDEVATCLRMFARDHLLNLAEGVLKLMDAILSKAEKSKTIMPGFTHLQYAQPTKLSHHLLAYHDMLERDFERMMESFRRINKCPLGSAAFASTPYKLDRRFTAKILGFDGVVENSEDAVASRDFLIEAVYNCTSLMLSLSRIAEEIVLFSSEFGFVDLPDEYSSTSSIMPQKKNPDIAELIRAGAGRMIGNLTAAMTIYKAMPFSYNRDFQEMNPILYESFRRAELAVDVMAGMINKMEFREDVMREKAAKGFAIATEVADTLVMKYNVPFRIAHRIVGRLAAEGVEKPTAADLERMAKNFGLNLKIENLEVDVEKAVESRSNIGGTSEDEIRRMIKVRREELNNRKRKIRTLRGRIAMSLKILYDESEKLGVRLYG